MTDEKSADHWRIKCSNENLSECIGDWEPSPEEVENVYNVISQGGPFQLSWECPGYRSPSPTTPTTPIEKEPENLQSEDKSDDFDFMDDLSSPSLRVRREGESELKGSAKKKTTSLDGVLSNMRRHRRLQQLEKDGPRDPQ